ncbi:MAG TPA: hypothetical protein DCM54_13360 [Gammaproteobacteria bacterium]|nr:hypothetical protein [Gammaproteobacteria bacterium]|tara:strand:- start:859 stop:1266 length:408 start_codon:yes stop_codon:yes gene_type:complete
MDINVAVVVILSAIVSVLVIEYLSSLWIKAQSKGLTRIASMRYLDQELRALTANSRMRRMARRKGVALHELVGDEQLLDEAKARCEDCDQKELCEAWLDGDSIEASFTTKAEGSFCPNSAIFEQLPKERQLRVVA